MGMALTIFHQLFILLSLAAVGWLLTKTGRLSDDKALSGLISNAALPALVIHSLQVPYSASLLRDIGLAAAGLIAVTAAGIAIGFLLGILARRSAGVTGTWTACIAFTNAVFMGKPIMLALYGERVLPLIAGILFAFNISTFLFGSWLLSLESTRGKRAGLRDLLTQPAVISCVTGMILFFMPFRLPGSILGFLEMLSVMTTPLSMVIIGSQLAKCSLRDIFGDGKVWLVCFARLVPAALAGHFLLRLFIGDPVMLGVLTVCACMPGAAIVPVIAAERGGDALFCSKATFVSTLMCAVTVPVLIPLLMG